MRNKYYLLNHRILLVLFITRKQKVILTGKVNGYLSCYYPAIIYGRDSPEFWPIFQIFKSYFLLSNTHIKQIVE